MDKPLVILLLLPVMFAVWVLSIQSVIVGKWIGQRWNIRRDDFPIWFWCGVGLQNLISSYFIIDFLRRLYLLCALWRGGA